MKNAARPAKRKSFTGKELRRMVRAVYSRTLYAILVRGNMVHCDQSSHQYTLEMHYSDDHNSNRYTLEILKTFEHINNKHYYNGPE